ERTPVEAIRASGKLGLYPPPCGEGRPPKRSEGGRGGGRSYGTQLAPQLRPPPPTPPHKGEGSPPTARRYRALLERTTPQPGVPCGNFGLPPACSGSPGWVCG